MWAVDDPDRLARALAASHRVTSRVEVWSDGVLVTESAPFLDGTVTDTWVSGLRRHLDLTVPPTRQWFRWFDLGSLELRPFRGVRFSASSSVECPLGVFPVLRPGTALPVSDITIAVDDLWSRVQHADFADPTFMPSGSVEHAFSFLFRGAGLEPPGVPDVSLGNTKRVLIEKSRSDALVELARANDVEVFIDRGGASRVRKPPRRVPATSEVLVGFGGTATGVVVEPDWARVFNIVSVTSTAPDVVFAPQVAALTDVTHPAHPYNMGTRDHPDYRVFKWSSGQLFTAAQAHKTAVSLLQKVAGGALTYSYDCVPDPSRDAGDSVLGSTRTSTVTAQIETVTHPLTAAGVQKVTTVSTQAVVEDAP